MTTPAEIAALLDNVYDPELGVDIVSLGLVYGIEASEGAIHVAMTTTSPMCPMGAALVSAVQATLEHAFPGRAVAVDVIRDPEWEIGMIHAAARARLRIR